MAKNKNLRTAADKKNDEFYTQLSDIENELKHYRDHLKDKIIFCNCDDPEWSNFWRYFELNFDFFGLKKLVSTHYETDKPSYKLEKIRGVEDVIKTPLKQNGDFRSPECVDILKESDIVITNPPFSLFREYVAQLVEYKKNFILIGSKNVITYKEIFPLMKENKMWVGMKPMSGSLWFETPDGYSSKNDKIINGKKLTPIACCWFTNLDIKKRHEELILYKEYTPEEYPKYDNYDAINIDKSIDIPKDYTGTMGVPVTFMDKYNPDQFEIIGFFNNYNPETADINQGQIYGDPVSVSSTKSLFRGPVVDGQAKYFRILIKHKEPKGE